MYAIETNKLSRIYKIKKIRKKPASTLAALNNVDLTVGQGELFGLLGPNGAGKTTLIKILTTILGPSSGTAKVDGLDVEKEAAELRKRINMVSGGETSGYGLLTVRENLWMFTQFYGIPSNQAYPRVDELIKLVGLEEKADTKCSDLSTGLRQKMNIIRGFMTDPQVLFLDEPTLGLDVTAARDIRQFVRGWVDENKSRTLLLTTHYMVEAEELCDRVAIIDKGRVLAVDTPEALKATIKDRSIYTIVVNRLDEDDFASLKSIEGISSGSCKQTETGCRMELAFEEDGVINKLMNFLSERGSSIQTLHKREPSLEDVFIKLVGRSLSDAEKQNGN